VAKVTTTTQQQQQQTAEIKIAKTINRQKRQKQQIVVDKATTINGQWKKQQQPPSGKLLLPPSWSIVSYSYFDFLIDCWLPPPAATTATSG